MATKEIIVTTNREIFVRDKASSVIVYPGMLLELTATLEVIPHSTAGGVVERMIAVEDTNNLGVSTTPYVADSMIRTYYPLRSSEIRVAVNTGTVAITKNMKLISDGAGGVKPAVGTETGFELFAIALEDLDNSAGTDIELLKVEVL
jgi:hypothetical protein